MDMPFLLTKDLLYLRALEDDNHLYQTLVQKIDHFVFFVEIACNDSFWANDHINFLQKSISWLTEQFSNGKLSLDYAKRLQKLAHLHYEDFPEMFIKDFEVRIGKNIYKVNILLFAMGSKIFHEYVRYFCMDLHKKMITIEDYSDAYFAEILEYIHSGTVADLWKREMVELLEIIRVTSEWKIYGLSSAASEVFTKYLNKNSAIQYIKLAQKEGLSNLKYALMDFLNSLELGLELYKKNPEYLGFRFNEYGYGVVEIFEELNEIITHLSFRSSLIDKSVVEKAILTTPKLIALDLADTTTFPLDISILPLKLIDIDLSVCSWLNFNELESIFKTCPQLLFLKLKHNIQLTHKSWEKLNLLKALESLDVELCHQLKDEDLILIALSCPSLRKINLEGCSLLTDQSFVEFAKNLPLLESINLCSTSISDSALSELIFHCPRLKEIKIDRCKRVSEKFRQKIGL